MVVPKTPGQLNDKLTIDLLTSSYMDHQHLVEDLALSEIQSLELAMPRFNTLACLNKTQFNAFLSQLKRKGKNTQTVAVMIVAITDTYTCMIASSRLYDNYAGDTRRGFELIIELLQVLKGLIVYCVGAIHSQQLPILISLLEKSAKRIQNETKYYDIMQEIILAIKNKQCLLDAEEIKNSTHVNNNVWDSPGQNEVKENFKPAILKNKKASSKKKLNGCTQTTIDSQVTKPVPIENNKKRYSKKKLNGLTQTNVDDHTSQVTRPGPKATKKKEKKSKSITQTTVDGQLTKSVPKATNKKEKKRKGVTETIIDGQVTKPITKVNNKKVSSKKKSNDVTQTTVDDHESQVTNPIPIVNNKKVSPNKPNGFTSTTVGDHKSNVIKPLERSVDTVLKPKIDNKKTANAFDLMMSSSKILSKKRKRNG